MDGSFDFSRLVTPQTYADLTGVCRKTVYNRLKTDNAPPHELIDGKIFLYRPGQEPDAG